MINIFNYIDKDSSVHKLTGATKFLVLVIWTVAAMITYDTRFLFLLFIISLVLFKVSKIKFREVKFLLWFTFVFMVLNNVLVFVFSPSHGTTIYGTRTVVWKEIGYFTLTYEQLFYHLNLVLKYLASMPIIILFVSTTNPSEFASSLNKIGISYKITYSVSIALRYIPDIQREYHEISQSQQARGMEMDGKKQNVFKRIKNATLIVFPLIISSMERINVVADAMELRGFGKNKHRTWYTARPFKRFDYISIVFTLLLLGGSITMNILNHGRFYNPFVNLLS